MNLDYKNIDYIVYYAPIMDRIFERCVLHWANDDAVLLWQADAGTSMGISWRDTVEDFEDAISSLGFVVLETGTFNGLH